MGRIRTIKPEFPQSESMGRVSRDARLLFVQLWTICDDSGRTRAASRMLASLLFPYDEDAGSLIDGWLAELQAEGCIDLYKVGGNTFLQINNWLNHQKIDKPSTSKIPPFDESSRILANPRERSSLDQGPRTKEGTKDQGEDQGSGIRCEQPKATAPAKADSAPETNRALNTETWAHYAAAYQTRYRVEPVRNAKVNGQIANLGKRIGADAPQVAAWFIGHQSAYYIQRGHSLDCLLADCEKLRTEWATGRTVTTTQARVADKSASNPFLKLLMENRNDQAA